ncbi:MAG: hypothetical protein ACSHX8_00275 [Opitutaceae bacterium]
MYRLLHSALFLLLTSFALGQDTLIEVTEEVDAVVLETVPVEVELLNQVWFTDRVGTAVAYFDNSVEPPEAWSLSNSEINFIEVSVQKTTDTKRGNYAATIRFVPRKTGKLTLPSLFFESETKAYETEPIDLVVSEPIRSDTMSLTLTPKKTTVYVGEALHVGLTWDCQINAAELQDLKLYPDFFNDSTVDIVIPRNTEDENKQMGIPVGGRRVIATRTTSDDKDKALGHIELPLYLRFNEPGTYTLPATRLECARLAKTQGDFARYAAHFNNALFETVDTNADYTRIYTLSAPIEIEVLPLPINAEGAEFAGLFAPIDFEVSLNPTEVEIGQLMELTIKVSGHAPHGMIELPTLSYQAGLRERFLVDNELSRIWHQDGTTFKARLRALSTKIEAFPSLQFLIFDPQAGTYIQQTTDPIPLITHPSEGQNFIPLTNYKGAAVTLSNQPEGIWHNLKANRMNDLLNTVFDLLNRYFWIWIILGPVAFICCMPVINEQRRRAKDARYRKCAEAYKNFKGIQNTSAEKWPAFLELMAAHFGSSGKAWTQSDSIKALRSMNASTDEIEHITKLHQAADARDFSSEHPEAAFSQLETLAKRVFKHANLWLLTVLFVSLFFNTTSEASDWAEAEQLFTQAQSAAVGSQVANDLYAQAAFKFQSEAEQSRHPDAAWVNAGNAWFECGAIGRSIAAYRIAQSYRPFDKRLSENISAARALTLNDIPAEKKWWQQIPMRWLQSTVAVVSILFWISLIGLYRFRTRKCGILSACIGLVFLITGLALLRDYRTQKINGTVIVDTLYAKKGPAHAYANAFNEPLHDGAEFTVLENREDWSLVELSDGRQCWIPNTQITTWRD